MKTGLLALTVLSAMLISAIAQAQTIQLINQNSEGLAADGGSGGARGQNVELLDKEEAKDSQLWVERYRHTDLQGNDYFAYEMLGTDFCIDGDNGAENNQNVYLWDCVFANQNQHWLKVDLGNGYFRLVKRNAPEFSLAEKDQNIVLQNTSGSQSQGWRTEFPAGEPDTTTDEFLRADVSPNLNNVVDSAEEAAAFLTQATFGPTERSIAQLQDMGYSEWFKQQLDMPIVDMLEETRRYGAGLNDSRRFNEHSLESFFQRAINGNDQLRQRAAFALSQIFATGTSADLIIRKSHLHASYKDTMQRGAFGNFRDLLENVTYHPLMGFYLTYAGNQKANEETGSMPDENYAREIMQLFTIGLAELDEDGSPILSDGQPIETYDNDDVIELAKIFTGLYYSGRLFNGRTSYFNSPEDIAPMVMHNDYHSDGPKTFLGSTVPDLGDGDAEISAALDILFEHDNVAPFICAQLIQRLTYSNPHGRNYTRRCSRAFNKGNYTLPDGSVVGSGERGDLTAVWAAILLDPFTARNPNRTSWRSYGKAREPVIGFVHWARVADVDDTDLEGTSFRFGFDTAGVGQTPYQSPSVFNFYRPGYVPTATSIGSLGKVAPELQIFTASTLINYANNMRYYNLRAFEDNDEGFIPKFTRELALATNPEALANHLNLVMTAGRMDDDTVRDIVDTIESIELSSDTNQRNTNLLERVVLAMQLAVTSSEFRTQH